MGGRATEMGRPLMFIPGIGDLSDAQTSAAFCRAVPDGQSLRPLRHSADRYECELPGSAVAEEIVRASHLEAGRKHTTRKT